MTLASLGLGSLAFGVWMAEHRLLFVVITFVFLGFAFYRTYFVKRASADPWSKRMLFVTTVLSIGLVTYSLLFR